MDYQNTSIPVLLASFNECIDSLIAVEQRLSECRTTVRQYEEELETEENFIRAEQLALGKEGVMKASTVDDRKVQLQVFLDRTGKDPNTRYAQLRLFLKNARIEEEQQKRWQEESKLRRIALEIEIETKRDLANLAMRQEELQFQIQKEKRNEQSNS